MSAVASRRIPNVVFGLTFFWAGISSAFFWQTGFSFSFLAPWALSLITGVALAQSSSGIYKKQVLATLKYREKAKKPVSDRSAFLNSERGILSSLGPVPFQYPPLPSTHAYAFSDLKKHSPKELAADNGLENVLGKFLSTKGREDYAPYVAIFDAIARIYLHPLHINLPAGISRHGDRTLITHSILVCALMMHRAAEYTYRTGSLSPIDPNFKLDRHDPLIPIIGFCHDIGKIRTLIFDTEGKATGFKPGHDLHSARLLAMLPEFWDERINSEERRVLQATLAYDHHMSAIPVQKNERARNPIVTSDRLHALLGLLSESDRLASEIEMGATYNFKVKPVLYVSNVPTIEEAKEDLFVNFENYIAVHAPINARNGTKSIAFKYKDNEFTNDRHILIVDEVEFVDSFSKYMKKPELNVRDGKSSPITSTILTMLDENGYLFRPIAEVGHRSAINCLFSFEFIDQAKEPDKVAFHIKSGFMFDVTDWPRMDKLRALPNCNSKPSIGSARFGIQGLSRRASAADNITASELTGAAPIAIGQSIESLIVKKSASLNARLIDKIGIGFTNNKLKVTRMLDDGIAITGHDSFFNNLGLTITEYNEVPLNLKAIGIIRIKKSKINVNEHAILLSKPIYEKFLGHLTEQ